MKYSFIGKNQFNIKLSCSRAGLHRSGEHTAMTKLVSCSPSVGEVIHAYYVMPFLVQGRAMKICVDCIG